MVDSRATFLAMEHVCASAFLKVQQKERSARSGQGSLFGNDRGIAMADKRKVESFAHMLEGTMTMVEEVDSSEMVVLHTTAAELRHFVTYMRQLDNVYRAKVVEIARIDNLNKSLRDDVARLKGELKRVAAKQGSDLTKARVTK